MEHFIRSFKVLWRSERLLRRNELRLVTQRLQCNALAGLVALFGIIMLSLSLFFALAPYIGNALAALTVGVIAIALAALLVAYGRALKPAAEVAMVAEMRDMAMSDIESELTKAEAEISKLRSEVRRFVRNPLEALLPSVIVPLMGAVAKGVPSIKKKTSKPETD